MLKKSSRIIALIILFFPFILLIRILRPIILIRFGYLYASRIGNYSANTENYLCERDMGKYPSNSFDIFGPDDKACNDYLTKLWKRHLIIIPNIALYLLCRANAFIPFGKVHNITLPSDRHLFRGCEEIEPHIVFNDEEERRGKEYLTSRGLSANDKFVCFFARDSTYLKTEYSHLPPEILAHNDCRDADINTFKKAIDYLTQDYYALRMGSVTKKPYPYMNEKIIEYANNGDRDEFLDIYLPARCSLFVQSGESFAGVPRIFKTPIVALNFIYFPECHDNPNVNFIPKKVWSKKYKRLLTFKEMLPFTFTNFRTIMPQEELECIDNTTEEIKDVVMEANMRINGTWQESEEDILLQQRFQAIFPEDLYDTKYRNLIGAKFLKQNKQLLD